MENSLIGWSAIIRTIRSELADLVIDLIQQRLQLRGITGFLICQTMCNDLATVGINRQVQFSPATAGLCPMLFFQPLAGALDLQPGAVDQHVKRCIWRSPSLDSWHPGSCPPTECRVIGHRQIQSHQRKHRTQKPFALAQSQAEYDTQHQRRLNG